MILVRARRVGSPGYIYPMSEARIMMEWRTRKIRPVERSELILLASPMRYGTILSPAGGAGAELSGN